MPNSVQFHRVSLDAALVSCFLLRFGAGSADRESSEDTGLGGFKLPAGTKVGINVLGMHHDPKHFPDPQVGIHLFLAVATFKWKSLYCGCLHESTLLAMISADNYGRIVNARMTCCTGLLVLSWYYSYRCEDA